MQFHSSTATGAKELKVALCQFHVGADKAVNIRRAEKAIEDTLDAELVILPEIWNSPYSTACFRDYAEKVPSEGEIADEVTSPSTAMLQNKARTMKKWVVGGSVPERDADDKIYNTCLVFDDKGTIVAKHRKVHLFDIDVPGKIKFTESDVLSAGMKCTVFDSPWGVIGLGICYDIRFPEYATLMRQLGARIFAYPGAFNMVTGPAHWELLQRSRALDNQVFVLTCSPARATEGDGYLAWGHSSVANPWGEVIATTGHEEAIVFSTLKLEEVDTTRNSIPCWKGQKRPDVYCIDTKTSKL